MAALSGYPDLHGPGTPETRWAAARFPQDLPRGEPPIPRSGRVVVVAPHPDDEIFGVGGIGALVARNGSRLELVAVTDGEASHPGRAEELRRVRPIESARAARVLGLRYHRVHRLGQPDGAVDIASLRGVLASVLRSGDVVLAPWWRDGHPDHDAVGAACQDVCATAGADLLAYLVWAWHWARPEADLPWDRAIRIELGPAVAMAKTEAAQCFQTQIAGPDPILPPPVLARLLRPFEVLVRE